jgi:hypothetical protein
VIAGLVILLVYTSRRWGRPRLYVRGVLALWLVAAILAVILVRLLIG